MTSFLFVEIILIVAFNIIVIVSSFIADKNWFNECMKINEEWANYCIEINQEWSNSFCELNDSLQGRINVLEREVQKLSEHDE